MDRGSDPPDPERLFATNTPSRGHFLAVFCKKVMILGGSLPSTRFLPVRHGAAGSDVLNVRGVSG